MKPVPSTAEILMHKMLGHYVDEQWVAWAYDMLCAGFDTENLVQLAGETAPYNQFELKQLTDRIFNELNLKWDDRKQVYTNYIIYLLTLSFKGEQEVMMVLKTIKDIYLEDDYDSFLQDFAHLYWAHDDLSYSEDQWYWDGATRENIDAITQAYFEEWLEKYGVES